MFVLFQRSALPINVTLIFILILKRSAIAGKMRCNEWTRCVLFICRETVVSLSSAAVGEGRQVSHQRSVDDRLAAEVRGGQHDLPLRETERRRGDAQRAGANL